MVDDAVQVEEQEELTEVELPETDDDQLEEQEEVKAEAETKETSDEIEDYSESVKKRIAKLTYKIRESERRETAALDYAKSVQEELSKTKNKLSKTDKNLYDEYKGRVSSELLATQDRYKKAYENGDTDALMEAQKDLAKLAVEEESLNRVKARQPEEVEQPVENVEEAIQRRIQSKQQAPQIQEDPKARAWATKKVMTLLLMIIIKK